MGLHVSVYRNGNGDSTNGGMSATAQSLCLVNVDGPFEPDDKHPAALLQMHHKDCLRVVPAVKTEQRTWMQAPGWLMNGGNYAACSDGRFVRACEALLGHHFYGAVAIHDRTEG